MSQPPTSYRALDYGLRWGIEAMFSDTKTRGFNLEDSQLRRADRIERLILILALALYWAVSTGMWDAVNNPSAAEKKPQNTAHADTLAPCSPSSSEASVAS
jgi:cytochrome c-type biogenesis protein CcmH/NrfG